MRNLFAHAIIFPQNMDVVRFYRGTHTPFGQKISNPLALKNFNDADGLKGVFFSFKCINAENSRIEQVRLSAEHYAKMHADVKSTQALVVTFDIDESKFDILKNHVYIVKGLFKAPRELPIDSFSFLVSATYEQEVTVDGSNLTPEALMSLGIAVGMPDQNGSFIYEPFEGSLQASAEGQVSTKEKK